MQMRATETITKIQKENIASKWGAVLKEEITKHREAVAVANRRYDLLVAKNPETSLYMKQYLKQNQVEAHANLHIFVGEAKKWIKIWGIDFEAQKKIKAEKERLRL